MGSQLSPSTSNPSTIKLTRLVFDFLDDAGGILLQFWCVVRIAACFSGSRA